MRSVILIVAVIIFALTLDFYKFWLLKKYMVTIQESKSQYSEAENRDCTKWDGSIFFKVEVRYFFF